VFQAAGSEWTVPASWLAWLGNSVRPAPFYLWMTFVPLLFPTGAWPH